MQYVTYPGGASLFWVVVIVGGILGVFYLLTLLDRWLSDKWKR